MLEVILIDQDRICPATKHSETLTLPTRHISEAPICSHFRNWLHQTVDDEQSAVVKVVNEPHFPGLPLCDPGRQTWRVSTMQLNMTSPVMVKDVNSESEGIAP